MPQQVTLDYLDYCAVFGNSKIAHVAKGDGSTVQEALSEVMNNLKGVTNITGGVIHIVLNKQANDKDVDIIIEQFEKEYGDDAIFLWTVETSESDYSILAMVTIKE